MTAHRTSTLNTGTATVTPATPIASDADKRLLKKVHAIRPMVADREDRKKLDELPPRTN